MKLMCQINENYIKKVQIETINDCDGRCLICSWLTEPHKLRPTTMPMKKFKTIVQNVSEHMPNVHTICPYNHNEPLLDRKIWKRIRWIKKNFPQYRIELSTNGYKMSGNKRHFKNFCELVDDRWISFHGVDDWTYMSIMGRPWEYGKRIRKLIYDHPEYEFRVSTAVIPELRMTVENILDYWDGFINVKPIIFEPRDRCASIQNKYVKSVKNGVNPDWDCWRFKNIAVFDVYGDLIPCSNQVKTPFVISNWNNPYQWGPNRFAFKMQNRTTGTYNCKRCEDNLS